MARCLYALAALGLWSTLSLAAAAEGTPATDKGERICPSMANEVTKSRELNRELNAYAGRTVPDELQQRVMKHISVVSKLKAECEAGREQAAAKK